MNSRHFLPLIILSTAFIGCTGSPSIPPQEPADDAAAVTAIEKIATEVKQDGNGVVTEVNFRETKIGDDDLALLKDLRRPTSLLLNDTQVTDEGLKVVGEIESLRNLDLRGCKISNDGLAHLTGLKNLVSLKLTGKGSLCTVDDDGVDHIAKLTNLKAGSGSTRCGLAAMDWRNSTRLRIWKNSTSAATTTSWTTIPMQVIAANFPKLKKLRISKSTVSATGLAHLTSLANLEDTRHRRMQPTVRRRHATCRQTQEAQPFEFVAFANYRCRRRRIGRIDQHEMAQFR